MPEVNNVINVNSFRQDKAAQDLLNWMESQFPGSKQKVIALVGASELGQVEVSAGEAPWYSKVIDAAGQVATTYFQSKVQKETTDLQIERARQGLPPLDLSLYGAAPVTTQIDFKMSPQTKMLIWAGVAVVAAIFLVPMLTRKR
jgi:hypothetical protein